MQRRASTGGATPPTTLSKGVSKREITTYSTDYSTAAPGAAAAAAASPVPAAPAPVAQPRRARRSSLGASLGSYSKPQLKDEEQAVAAAAAAPTTAAASSSSPNRRRPRRASIGASISNWFQGARKEWHVDHDEVTSTHVVYYTGREGQEAPVAKEEGNENKQEEDAPLIIIDHVEIVGLELLMSSFSADDIDDFSYDSYCQDSYAMVQERLGLACSCTFQQHQHHSWQQLQLQNSFSQQRVRLESWEEDLDDAKEKYGYEGAYGNSFRRSKNNFDYEESPHVSYNNNNMMQQHTQTRGPQQYHHAHPRRRYSTGNNSSSSFVRRGSAGGNHSCARRGSMDSGLERSFNNNNHYCAAHNCINFERCKAMAAVRRGSVDSTSYRCGGGYGTADSSNNDSLSVGFERYKATSCRRGSVDSYANDSVLQQQPKQRRGSAESGDYSIGFEQYKAAQRLKRRGSMESFSSSSNTSSYLGYGDAQHHQFATFASTAGAATLRDYSNHGSFANDSIENYGRQQLQQRQTSRRGSMGSSNHRSLSLRNLSIGTGCSTGSFANDSIGNYGRQQQQHQQQLRRGSATGNKNAAAAVRSASLRNLSIGTGCSNKSSGGAAERQQSFTTTNRPFVRRMSNTSLNSALSNHTGGMNRAQ
jgi:hypothetical protein